MGGAIKKGDAVSLSTEVGGGLDGITLEFNWSLAVDLDFDLDVVAFCLNENSKVRSHADFIFWSNLKSADGSIEHLGDLLFIDGGCDIEQIRLNLKSVPADVTKFAMCLVIFEAEQEKLNFGMLSKGLVRVVSDADGKEIARYEFIEDTSTEYTLLCAEVYRDGEEWKFKAVGEGFAGGLKALVTSYGVKI